jgi:ABC-type bacteriocin/lantibiotic exporter with double-glycine peptidase domain
MRVLGGILLFRSDAGTAGVFCGYLFQRKARKYSTPVHSMQPKPKNSSVLYLTRFGKPYLPLIILSLGLLVAGRVLVSIQPIWLKKVIDGIAANNAFTVILGFLIVYFLLSLGQIVFDFLRDFVFAPAQQGISSRMAEALYTHLLDLPSPTITSRSSAH